MNYKYLHAILTFKIGINIVRNNYSPQQPVNICTFSALRQPIPHISGFLYVFSEQGSKIETRPFETAHRFSTCLIFFFFENFKKQCMIYRLNFSQLPIHTICSILVALLKRFQTHILRTTHNCTSLYIPFPFINSNFVTAVVYKCDVLNRKKLIQRLYFIQFLFNIVLFVIRQMSC